MTRSIVPAAPLFVTPRLAAGSQLLTYKGINLGHRLGPALRQNDNRFAQGGACRETIIHNHHPAFGRGADQHTALAMILGFLAVVGVGHVAAC